MRFLERSRLAMGSAHPEQDGHPGGISERMLGSAPRALCGVIALVGCGTLLSLSCQRPHAHHDHSEEHAAGHDHHDEGHGHGDSPTILITKWSERFELFAEHEPAVVGESLSLLVHLTTLHDFRAVEKARAVLRLGGPEELTAAAREPLRPGIFQLQLTPRTSGKYTGSLAVEGEVSGAIVGLELVVHSNASAAKESVEAHSDDGAISFLKEQQWGVPFATAFPTRATLAASLQVSGQVQTPPGGSAYVGAPIDGRIVAPRRGLLRPGTLVKQGQLLASIAPTPASPEAATRASLAVAEADARAAAAKSALARAERLIRDQAISEQDLEAARRESTLAAAAVRSARRGAALFSGAIAGTAAGSWQLKAPISGTLVKVSATPGATVSQGQRLFRIVDTRELWIVARVPEHEVAKLRIDREARFRVIGADRWLPMRVTGAAPSATVIMVGRTVDPSSRTVEVIYALEEPDANLRVGGMVDVGLPAGENFEGVVVPTSAIIDQEGRHVVYVQIDGEHFVERLVRLGPRSGDRVGVLQGLALHERIVVKGAHLVRLAERARGAPAHGHVH